MQELDHILNWRRVNNLITTSGQPSESQLAEISALGVTHIINLGLGYGKDALQDEAGKVEALGMKYIHIPVDFEKPTAENFEHFKTALEENAASQIHVHCIYNARVSAFFFRLSKSGTALTEASAFAIMDSIWKPGDDWAIFIGDENAKGRPNRYAGEDY